MTRSFHFVLDIHADYRRWGEFITDDDGRPVTAYEFERQRQAMLERGFECFPATGCTNLTANGHCGGHDEDVPDAPIRDHSLVQVDIKRAIESVLEED